jgi:pimeloyl-ACP methyl ester carboxylesterase
MMASAFSIKNSKQIFERIFIAISFMLLVDKSIAQHTYGSFYTKDAFVNFILSKNKTEKEAIIMIPGANLSTYIYITTPDGRKGWGDLFADKGYDVYMVNDPRYDFATGGIVAPFKVPSNGKPATPGSQQGWQNDIWTRWGFGTSQGNPYPNALFPTDSFSVFAKNYPYLGSSNDNYAEAVQAVIDSTRSKVWLMAHSAGASRAVTAARQKNKQVKGLIMLEPAGPPDSSDFPDLNGMHMFGVYCDYIVSRNQTSRKLATEQVATYFQKAGGVGEVVSLPEDSLVFGNSHLMMQDKNSKYIFEIVERWISQFRDNNVDVKTNHDTDFQLYPNPAGNEVRVNDKSMNDTEYSVYSLDGILLRKSKIKDQKIDLTAVSNGLLLIKFKINGQYIVKKIMKNGQ